MSKIVSVSWLVVGCALACLVVTVPLDLRAQACFGAATFALAILVQGCWPRRRSVTLALMLMSVVISSRYVYFRLTQTLPDSGILDIALGLLLLSAELYSFLMLLLGYLQSAWPLERLPVSMPGAVSSWPTVDVFIPTYSEPLKVVAPTVLAAAALDWPREKLRVYVLDDGCRPEFRRFALNAGVQYLSRTERTHAKAGNINHALAQTDGEFVAVFDCDHVPTRSFLQMTLGWLVRDRRIAMVQTPHHFYSPDPFEKNLHTFRKQPNEGELFYGLIQRGNDLWNAAFFCGSCAVLRRSSLVQVGGIAVETVTEDAHTALRLSRHGYHTAYLGIAQAGGLATDTLAAHVGQRRRWARGMAQIFRVDNPLWGRGLSIPQRLCYLASMLHFFHGLPRLIFLLSPLSFLWLDAQILRADPALVLAYALPHLSHSVLTNSGIQGRFRASFWSEVYECCLAPYILLPTLLALLSPRLGRFNVTEKGKQTEEAYFDRGIARPHLILAAFNLLGIAAGALRWYAGSPHLDVTQLNMLWASYNLLLLGATLAVAHEARQRRAFPRIGAKLPVSVRLKSGHMRSGEARDLSLDGASLRLEQPSGVEEGMAVHLCIVAPRVRALSARVLSRQGSEVRLRFEALCGEQQRALVEAVFARANAWSGWSREHERDRPLRQFLSLFAYGVLGLWRAASAPSLRRTRT